MILGIDNVMPASRSIVAREPPLPGRACIAIVNDYEVIVAGVRAMLAPCRARLMWSSWMSRPNRWNVAVALFDVYGQPGLGVDRIRSLAKCDNVGAVAIYTWSLNDQARKTAVAAGATGLIAKSLPADKLADAVPAVAPARWWTPVGSGAAVKEHGPDPTGT